MPPHPLGCQPTALQVHPAIPLHPVGCQPTSLQVRLDYASFSRASLPALKVANLQPALQLSLTMPPHPVGCQPTALQVHPAIPLHPVGCQPTSLQVRLSHASFSRTSLSNYASSPCRLLTCSPTGSSSHASSPCRLPTYSLASSSYPCLLRPYKFVYYVTMPPLLCKCSL